MSRLPFLKRLQWFCNCRRFVHSFDFEVHFRISAQLHGVYIPQCVCLSSPKHKSMLAAVRHTTLTPKSKDYLAVMSLQSYDSATTSLQSYDSATTSLQSYDFATTSLQSYDFATTSLQSYDSAMPHTSTSLYLDLVRRPVLRRHILSPSSGLRDGETPAQMVSIDKEAENSVLCRGPNRFS